MILCLLNAKNLEAVVAIRTKVTEIMNVVNVVVGRSKNVVAVKENAITKKSAAVREEVSVFVIGFTNCRRG